MKWKFISREKMADHCQGGSQQVFAIGYQWTGGQLWREMQAIEEVPRVRRRGQAGEK
jgi:hypothetical protein